MKSLLERLRMRRLASTFTILATLSAGIIIGSVVAHGVRGQEAKVDSSDATPLRVPAPKELSTDFTKIAKEVGPAVVNINTETLPKEQQQGRRRPGQRFRQLPQNPGNDDNNDDDQDQQGGGGDQGQGGMQDFFNRFFGMGPDQGQPDDQAREALGSGFIVDPKGYIITNNHVVEKADRIYVKLSTDPDGNQGHPAKVIGVDKSTDLAVIKIDIDHPLPTVKLGNSDSSQVGDWVVAIGSPFTLNQTVTAGIVSAKNRTMPGIQGQFQHFIQTDAAINPGNSGGPLLNMAGEVVGVNTAIFTQSAGYQGIGFAMPSNTVVDVYNSLIGPTHKVVRGSIGITFQSAVSSAVQRVYGAKNGGVIIRNVQPGFPADKAGLKPGDIITTIDGRPVKDGDDLVNQISARKPGSNVQLGYSRDGKQSTANVSIIDRTDMERAAAGGDNDDQNAGPGRGGDDTSQSKLGITVSDLPQNAPPGLHGVLIQRVKPGSFADEIGMSGYEGSVIAAVNKRPVNNKAEYNAIISNLKSGQDAVFDVVDPQHPKAGGQLFGGTLP